MNFKKAITLLLFSFFLAFVALKIWGQLHNTLKENNRWFSRKSQMKLTPMDAHQFWEHRLSLAGGALNLGSWHGHQQVHLKEELCPKEIQYDIKLNPGAYLTFLFNGREHRYQGLRLSNSSLYPGALLEISAQGKFNSKKFVPEFNIGSGSFRGHLSFGPHNQLSFKLNGKEIWKGTIERLCPQVVGFQGGEENSYVDHFKVISVEGKEFTENFEGKLPIFRLLILTLTCFFIQAFFLSWSSKNLNSKEAFYVLFIFIIPLGMAGGVFYFVDRWHFSHLYPEYAEIAAENETLESWQEQRKEAYPYFLQRKAEILEEGRRQQDNAPMVLFLGSSQTWGEGASAYEKTWVNLICQKEWKLMKKKRCLNAGIRAITSSDLVDFYQNHFLSLAPKWVVLVLSNNDYFWPDVFRENLKKLALLNKKSDIQTIFVLEPNEITTSLYSPNHFFMQEVGKNLGIPVLDPVKSLVERHDSGQIWWDFIHLTDYGHEIMAQAVWEGLTSLDSH